MREMFGLVDRWVTQSIGQGTCAHSMLALACQYTFSMRGGGVVLQLLIPAQEAVVQGLAIEASREAAASNRRQVNREDIGKQSQ